MLILRRKIGESIKINNNVDVTIVEVSGDVVKLAINAPKEVSIVRSELLMAADVNKESAAQKSDLSLLRDILKKTESSEREK